MHSSIIIIIINILIIVQQFEVTRCAKILGVWTIGGTSHYILGNRLMRGLAEAGHDVTLISPFEDNVPPKRGSFRNVVLTGIREKFQDLSKSNLFDMTFINSPFTPIFMQKRLGRLVDDALAHPNVQKLMKSGEQFDAVIIEHFSNDAARALADHFNAHLIIFSSIHASSWVNDMVANPMPLSYIPELATSFHNEMTFFERTANFLISNCRKLLIKLYALPAQEAIRSKYFTKGQTVYQSYFNVSLILLNGHESIHQPVPLVPNMIPIGGYHVSSPKKLPEDLQKILDESKDGVVYVSMGSNLRSKDMSPEMKKIFINSLGRLKEKVLWKWEEDALPNKPKNVETRKWFPQADILAHPNIKLFVTHGGLLSTTETIYHGKPILAIPVFGDQMSNAFKAEQSGFARFKPYHSSNWSEEGFYSLLRDMLDNPKYSQNAQKRSKLFHDRPLKPMDAATYWVDYVVRTKGAHHLRVFGVQLPWYKYLLLDVIAFLLLCSLVITFIIVKICKLAFNRCFVSKDKKKIKKS